MVGTRDVNAYTSFVPNAGNSVKGNVARNPVNAGIAGVAGEGGQGGNASNAVVASVTFITGNGSMAGVEGIAVIAGDSQGGALARVVSFGDGRDSRGGDD